MVTFRTLAEYFKYFRRRSRLGFGTILVAAITATGAQAAISQAATQQPAARTSSVMRPSVPPPLSKVRVTGHARSQAKKECRLVRSEYGKGFECRHPSATCERTKPGDRHNIYCVMDFQIVNSSDRDLDQYCSADSYYNGSGHKFHFTIPVWSCEPMINLPKG
jgi:hypothetical protein